MKKLLFQDEQNKQGMKLAMELRSEERRVGKEC